MKSEFRTQNSERGAGGKRLTRRSRVRAASAFCLLLFVLLVALAGCAKARAAAVPDGPPLTVPSAPAHQIPVNQIVEAPLQEPPPVAEAPPAPPPPAVTRQNPRTTAKPEAPAAATVAPPPPAPAEVVRVAPQVSADAEKKITELLRRAERTLELVDYKRLSKEGQAQYDQSKRFSDEAKQAIKEKNLVYAMTLADKAATLAAELPTR